MSCIEKVKQLRQSMQKEGNSSIFDSPCFDNPFIAHGKLNLSNETIFPEQFETIIRNLQRPIHFMPNMNIVAPSGMGKSTLINYMKEKSAEIFPDKKLCFVNMELCYYGMEDIISYIADGLDMDDVENADALSLAHYIQDKGNVVIVMDETEGIYTKPRANDILGYLRGLSNDCRLILFSRESLENASDAHGMTSPLYNVLEKQELSYSRSDLKTLIKNNLKKTAIEFSDEEIEKTISESKGNIRKVQELSKKLFEEKKRTFMS